MSTPRPCAVFDLDGCLIDSVPHFVTILNAMLGGRGEALRIGEADARPHATRGGLPMVEALLGDRCGEPRAALAEFRERYAALPTPADCLYPGVREALESLAEEGVTLAVWSNKTQPLCDKVIVDLGLSPLLSVVVGTRQGVPHKPDPTGLDLALTGSGSDRRHGVFVGDSELDYAAGQAAGVAFVLVTHGYGDYARDYPGARIIAGFSEAAQAVKASLSRAGALS